MWTGLTECRYFQALEGSTLPSKIGCGHVFIANWTPIAKACFCPECKMAVLILRQYGMISKHLDQESRKSPRMSISSLAASREHARISVLQDMEKAWQESEADYFSRSCAWPKKSSPSSYSLKTSQPFPTEGDFKSLERLPKWGMIADGVLYPLTSSSTRKGKDGFVLPNLMASDGSKGPAKIYNRQGKQSSMRNIVTISYRIWNAGPLSPEVCEKIMGYPTGWSVLEDWVTQFVLSKRKKLLKY